MADKAVKVGAEAEKADAKTASSGVTSGSPDEANQPPTEPSSSGAGASESSSSEVPLGPPHGPRAGR